MSPLERLDRRLQQPLSLRLRLALALLALPLALAFFFPLWKIQMWAPQYPKGLELRIHAHTVEGDVQEINTLNHYIGMAAIDRAALSDLDWIPFALGALVLLALRAAAIGTRRDAIDLLVLFAYFGAFSMARFAYKLYVFGHDLDPKAPFKMEPFTPALLGGKEIANFTTASWPAPGGWLLAVVGLALLAGVWLELRSAPR